MSVYVDPQDLAYVMKAFAHLPANVQNKHMRIAINAAGGVIRDAAKTTAPVETGLLQRALIVKAKVPQASYNIKHHTKPAYAVIGARRRFVLFLGTKKKVQVTKKNLAQLIEKYGADARVRVASRYVHLANRRTGFLANAIQSKRLDAITKMGDKLRSGFTQEAAKLAASQP